MFDFMSFTSHVHDGREEAAMNLAQTFTDEQLHKAEEVINGMDRIIQDEANRRRGVNDDD